MKKIKNKIIKHIILIFSIFIVSSIITFGYSTKVMATGTGTTTDTEDNTATEDTTSGSDNDDLSGSIGPFQFNLNTGEEEGGISSTLQIMLVLTLISLAPSILIMVTSFTRIIIVLHFVRSALGTQSTPPNQVLVGLALFLTFFIMSPIFTQINTEAIGPLNRGEITEEQALDAGIAPLKTFMLEQVKAQDLKLFVNIAEVDTESMESVNEIPTTVIIPAFIISELRTAFIIGFLIYIPFIIIDMVVASALMSMGMMMLPPTTISMPFKILLFVVADGWNLIIGSLVKTFY
ncbi:MAG: flagellar type III secretion system pore protein FliP [Anaerocolumna sp.]